MLEWRNWQTRQVEGLVPVKGVQVQVLSPALEGARTYDTSRSSPFPITGGLFRQISARRALSGVFRSPSRERVRSWQECAKRAAAGTARSASGAGATTSLSA